MALQLKLKKPDPEFEALSKVRPPKRLKIFLIKRHHRKRLLELSLKSLGQIPQLEKPNEEQEEWIKRKMSNPNTWPRVRENKIGDWKHWK